MVAADFVLKIFDFIRCANNIVESHLDQHIHVYPCAI